MPEPDAYHANLERGSLLLNQGRPRDALPFLQAAITADPDQAYAYAELARCWNEIPPERRKAIAAIDRAIGLAPYISSYHGRKSWFHICLLQYHTALKAAEAGLALDPACPFSLNALANVFTKLNQWRKTEEVCRRILALDPLDGPGLNLLAQALRHQGKWKESRAAVALLLANMPNDDFGHANAGFAALAAGDHLRANDHFRESLRLNPQFDLARQGLVQSLRNRIWIVRGPRWLYSTNRWVLIGLWIAWGLGAVPVGNASDQLNLVKPHLGDVLAGFYFGLPIAYSCLWYLASIVGDFLLLFDPVGRHAMSVREIARARALAIGVGFLMVLFLSLGLWLVSLALFAPIAVFVFSVQVPLLKDRWERRRVEQASR